MPEFEPRDTEHHIPAEPAIEFPAEPSPEVPIELELEEHATAERVTLLPLPSSVGPGGSSTMIAIRKDSLGVRLRLADGQLCEGDVFLSYEPGEGPHHALVRWLTELAHGFFPLREKEGTLAIVRTQSVRWVVLGEQAEPHLSQQQRVRFDLGGGETLDGVLDLDVATIAPRVSDVLNERRLFLVLHSGRERYAVNREAIQRVYDLGSA